VGENTTTLSPQDGVFVVYDKDVIKTDIFDSGFKIVTTNVALQNLNLYNGVPYAGNGWRSYFSNEAGKYKGMNELYALDNMLYVNVFNKDGVGTNGECGAGVKGDSYLFQYCLPYGNCSFYTAETTEVNQVKIGVGILGTGLGDAYNNAKNQLSLVVTREDELDCTKPENVNKPQCQLFDNSVRLKQLRWYETR
jgi:type IV pilus assembly protein PilY1